MLTPATHVGQIAHLSQRLNVPTAHGGVVLDWFAEDGDPAITDEPLLPLYPESDNGVGGHH